MFSGLVGWGECAGHPEGGFRVQGCGVGRYFEGPSNGGIPETTAHENHCLSR